MRVSAERKAQRGIRKNHVSRSFVKIQACEEVRSAFVASTLAIIIAPPFLRKRVSWCFVSLCVRESSHLSVKWIRTFGIKNFPSFIDLMRRFIIIFTYDDTQHTSHISVIWILNGYYVIRANRWCTSMFACTFEDSPVFVDLQYRVRANQTFVYKHLVPNAA